MLRIGLAPCSPFTVTNDLMIAAANLARQYEGVRLHTHLAENQVSHLLDHSQHFFSSISIGCLNGHSKMWCLLAGRH